MPLGTWFGGGIGSAGLMLGSDDLQGLFQPKQFCDSVTLFLNFFFVEQGSGSRCVL